MQRQQIGRVGGGRDLDVLGGPPVLSAPTPTTKVKHVVSRMSSAGPHAEFSVNASSGLAGILYTLIVSVQRCGVTKCKCFFSAVLQ